MRKKSQFLDRIVMPYFIILMIVITIVMILVYSSTLAGIRNNELNTQIKLADKTSQQIDEYISEFDMLAIQINNITAIRSLFYTLQNDGDMTDYFESNVMESIDMSLELKKLLPSNDNLYNIIIYNDKGDFLSTQSYQIDVSAKKRELAKQEAKTLMRRLLTGAGYTISKPSKNKWSIEKTSEYITYTTILKNEYSDYPCGIIEIRCNVEKFIGKVDTVNTPGIVICDRSNGDIIYPLSYTDEPDLSDMVTARCDKVNWEVLMPMSGTGAGAYSAQMLILFIGIYVVLALFMIQLVRFIGKHITRPLEQLTESVRRVRSIDSHLVIDEYSAMDEVKELEKSFEKMIERMQRSIEQDKKSYSLALQAQMNPHFLYNILSVISSAGSEGGCEPVTDMCFELSKMLRYVTDFTMVNVSLREEIEHTKSYLILMKYRYEEYFSYDIQIDEELLNISVPKLSIQPLVENCFKHGFKNKPLPWHIDIKMTGTYREWTLEISDNGVGIEPERIIEIRNIISNALSDMIPGGIGGIGLCNTIVRLKMISNEKLTYDMINDNGLKIIIKSKE